jgi:glycyl-tRNA synthetase alpha chain
VRTLARGVAQSYFNSRLEAGFPLADKAVAQEVIAKHQGES